MVREIDWRERTALQVSRSYIINRSWMTQHNLIQSDASKEDPNNLGKSQQDTMAENDAETGSKLEEYTEVEDQCICIIQLIPYGSNSFTLHSQALANSTTRSELLHGIVDLDQSSEVVSVSKQQSAESISLLRYF